MASTTEQMESLIPSADNEYLPSPKQDFTASDFASDTWEQARKRFMDAGIIDVDPNDPKLLTAYNRSMDYLKDIGLSGLLATQAAYEFAVGTTVDSVPFMSENNKGRLARDLGAMPEAFVGGGLKNLSLIDDVADAAATSAKQTISKAVDVADRAYVDPTKTPSLLGSFSLRTPGEDSNFNKARNLFKKQGGEDPKNFKVVNKKVYDQTGWYIDPSDGQWRYQLSDKNSKLDLKNFKVQIKNLGINQNKTLKLSDILTHDELFKRYPHLKNINVQFENRLTNPTTGGMPSLGSFYGGDNLIKINVNSDRGIDVSNLGNNASFKTTLFHEIQHAIQEYEGFIPGASPSSIPIEVTKKHSDMLVGNLQYQRNQRKKIYEEIEGSALEHKVNTDFLLSDFLSDKKLKVGNVLFTTEDEVIKKFNDAVKKAGLPPNIFDLPPGSDPTLKKLGDGLLSLRNSFQNDVKTKVAIGYIEDRIYRGVGGELDANVAEINLDQAQNKLRYPLEVKQDVIKNRELEDFTDSLDETAQQALIEEDPGYRRRQTYRKVDPGVVDAKIDIDLSKFKYHLLDKMKPAKDLSDPEYLAFLKLKEKGISQAKIQDEKTKFLLDNIAKNNSQLKKIKNLKRGDTFSYTLPNGKTVKVKLAFVKTQKVKRSDLNKTDDTLVIKDTRPNKSDEEMSDFNIPYAYLEIISPTVNDPVLKKSIPDLIKNSDLVKNGDNFDILDLADTRSQEGAFSKIKSLFGFAEGGAMMRPEPIDGVDISPRYEAGDQFFVKQAERERAFETKPMPRPSMDKSFPNVKPEPRPEGRSEFITRGYEVDGREIQVGIIKFKGGEEIAFDKVLQNIDAKGTANEPVVTKNTMLQVINFLKEKNPTREEFETYWYNKRLNKGGAMMDKQMQMAFMDEGGLTDDGMDVDPVSGNDIPSGSMAEEVRDDIPAQLSDGEYVVPADVVRYYGVKFFEDLRKRAKMGLQEMEMNGRIGGEPVPAGGPMNTEELSPEEMQAIQEMMGMSQGGSVNAYKAQQELLEQPPAKAVGNPVMMYGGGDVEADMLGGKTSAQVGQDFLDQGKAAIDQNYTGIPLGSTIFDSTSNTNNNQGVQQTEVKAFTPITLYNTSGQTRTVNSEVERKKAIADKYTMTLAEYNMYRSKRGGGGGNPTITPPGGEEKEDKPWGAQVNWDDPAAIRKFVDDAKSGNIDSSTGRFLQGAGYMLLGSTGPALVAAFQVGKGLKNLQDMQAAQIIADARGHDDLAETIGEEIMEYKKQAGGLINFLDQIFPTANKHANNVAKYQYEVDGFKNIPDINTVSDYKKGKGFDSKKSKQAGDSRKQKARQAFNKLQKNKDSYIKSSTDSVQTAKNVADLEKSLSASSQNPSGTVSLNRGGLMQKKKKAKK